MFWKGTISSHFVERSDGSHTPAIPSEITAIGREQMFTGFWWVPVFSRISLGLSRAIVKFRTQFFDFYDEAWDKSLFAVFRFRRIDWILYFISRQFTDTLRLQLLTFGDSGGPLEDFKLEGSDLKKLEDMPD